MAVYAHLMDHKGQKIGEAKLAAKVIAVTWRAETFVRRTDWEYDGRNEYGLFYAHSVVQLQDKDVTLVPGLAKKPRSVEQVNARNKALYGREIG